MSYTYVIEHIAGPQNIWADMISRLAGNHDSVATAIKRVLADTPGALNPNGETTETANPEVTEPIISTIRPLDDANFVWPTFDAISTVQSASHPPSGAERTPDGVLRLHGRIWIPCEAAELLQRLCIIAHCGVQGHRGGTAMAEHLRRIFTIENLDIKVAAFVRQCRLCLHSKGGTSSPDLGGKRWSDQNAMALLPIYGGEFWRLQVHLSGEGSRFALL
ncbi:hypothetical protein PR003_g16844 [Phytophthora rubi]|uniref:Integrase zinc-binding domain-containing protein n=1 Tax=Phytophthora rubi TaxID=129364 RepID=A0A6A4EJU6_9STRA|nr:hypothetical protein PR003_g16844 [Phytophthora rubi]